MLTYVHERHPGLVPSNVRDLLVSARARVPLGGRLPSVLVVGAQKAGTTSLHRILARQPDFSPGVRKELAYLNTPAATGGARRYARGFPVSSRLRATMTFESSTHYLCDPYVPGRAARTVPDAVVVAILRRPSDRALSHYHHNTRWGLEQLSYDDALAAEAERCGAPPTQIGTEMFRHPDAHEYAYAGNGRYLEALDRWMEQFDADRILVTTTDRLEVDPAPIVGSIRRIVGSDIGEIRPLETRYNVNPSAAAPAAAVNAELRELDERYERIAAALAAADPHGVAACGDMLGELAP